MRVIDMGAGSNSQEQRLAGAILRRASRLAAISRGVRATLLGLATVAALTLCATDASALIIHVEGRRLSYQPTQEAIAESQTQAKSLAKLPGGAGPGPGGPLEYRGGPVMTSNTNYALYWDPAGAPSYPSGYQAGINRYFEDLAHDSGGLQNTDSLLTQYYNAAHEAASYNSHFGGALTDTDPYPTSGGCSAAPICLTDTQIRAEIKKFVEANKLPTDLTHEYFLLTPEKVESCYEVAGKSCSAGTKHAAYCAYHSFISTEKGVIVYANDPYVDGLNCDYGEEHPNGNAADATIGGGLAHEHSESVTDPELNAWLDSKEEEVADKCRTFNKKTEYGTPLGKAPNGKSYNQVINGDLYLYQQMWSNESGECEQRVAVPPTVKKLSPKSGLTSGGTAVTITGTHFTSSSTVKFGETPALSVKYESPTSLLAVSPAGSPGKVHVTVTTVYGTSATVNKDLFKYKAPKK